MDHQTAGQSYQRPVVQPYKIEDWLISSHVICVHTQNCHLNIKSTNCAWVRCWAVWVARNFLWPSLCEETKGEITLKLVGGNFFWPLVLWQYCTVCIKLGWNKFMKRKIPLNATFVMLVFYIFKSHFNQHVSTRKKYNFCEASFSQNGNLKVHIALVHERKKSVKWTICDTSCGGKNELDIAPAHVKKIPFKCNLCDRFDSTKRISSWRQTKKK